MPAPGPTFLRPMHRKREQCLRQPLAHQLELPFRPESFTFGEANMRSLLTVGTFAAGALCFVTFLAMVKPISFGVKQSAPIESVHCRTDAFGQPLCGYVKSMLGSIKAEAALFPMAYR